MTPTDHPAPAELERFAAGTLSASARMRILLHLVSGCEACLGWIRPPAEILESKAPGAESDEYDAAIDRALAAVLRQRRALRREPAEAREIRASVERLLAESWDLRYDDPRKMVRKAELAVLAARRLAPPPQGRAVAADLQARTWAELGNAFRVADELKRADQALSQAMTLWEHGSGDPLLLARLADFTASLCCDQRRFAAAFELLGQARRIYEEQGDRHLAGRTLITMSYIASCAAEPEQALRYLMQGLPMIDSRRDANLLAVALKNLVLYKVECGQFAEAKHCYETFQRDRVLPQDPLSQLKLRWIEGKIFLGLAETAPAEAAFLEVRQGFLDQDLPYEAGLASLDLAIAWLYKNKTGRVQTLLQETYQIFSALEIDREAVAAVLLLVQASGAEQITVKLVKSVADFLNNLERRPGMRFEG
ncbi:MAG TPA: hypothetical protein VHU81_18245 [Thermoanaerobaculia bacterium]|nr:hypothetical protein [Thermoanaerobaculia bacterium]